MHVLYTSINSWGEKDLVAPTFSTFIFEDIEIWTEFLKLRVTSLTWSACACQFTYTSDWISPLAASCEENHLLLEAEDHACLICSYSYKVRVTLRKQSLVLDTILRNQFHTRSYTFWALFTYRAWKLWIKMPIILILLIQNLKHLDVIYGIVKLWHWVQKVLTNYWRKYKQYIQPTKL